MDLVVIEAHSPLVEELKVFFENVKFWPFLEISKNENFLVLNRRSRQHFVSEQNASVNFLPSANWR